MDRQDEARLRRHVETVEDTETLRQVSYQWIAYVIVFEIQNGGRTWTSEPIMKNPPR